jgi:acetyl esterase
VMTTRAHAVSLDKLIRGAPPTRIITFKENGGVPLTMAVFQPPDAKRGDQRTAAVWIHGGGWTAGDDKAFYPHARYLAMRGAVGISINYRLMKAADATAFESLADCKSAIRYVRGHAKELGIDPHRVIALGDSSGGHLAACLGTIKGYDDPRDDLSISCVPDAMVLCNPIVDCTQGTWWYAAVGPIPAKQRTTHPSEQILEKARALSPLFHIQRGDPPTLIMQGLEDHVVSPDQARRFAAAMKDAGNRCDLILLEHARHAFVCTGYTAPPATVVGAIRAIDEFLISLKFLSGHPTLDMPTATAPASNSPSVAPKGN